MRNRIWSIVATTAVVALITVVLPPGGAVAAPGDPTPKDLPIDVSEPGTIPVTNTAADIEQANLKLKLANEYYAVRFLGKPDTNNVVAQLEAYSARYDPSSSRRVRSGGVQPNVAYSSRILALTNWPQDNSFFCGPAAGKSMLVYSGPTYSARDGSFLSQSALGNANHMDTTARRVTSWLSGKFRIGINRWRNGTDSGFYVDTPSPSPSQFRNALSVDIDYHTLAFAADAVEFPGGAHYNNHPQTGQVIGHWLAVRGYSNWGSTTQFVDSSTSVWPNVQAFFGHATDSFVTTYLQSNGITW